VRGFSSAAVPVTLEESLAVLANQPSDPDPEREAPRQAILRNMNWPEIAAG
jgi:hypothetical protein